MLYPTQERAQETNPVAFKNVGLKPFLIIVDREIGDREREFFSANAYIQTWLAVFANSILLISESDALLLSDQFSKEFPNHIFLITELDEDAFRTNGRVPEVVWKFIQQRPSKNSLRDLLNSLGKR